MSPANELLFGGQAGPGKTDLVLGLAFEKHLRSLIMRRQYTDMGAMTERAIEINGTRDGYSGSNPMKLRPAGRDDQLIEFGACAKLGDEQHWQGQPHDLVCVGKGTPVLMGDGSYQSVETLAAGDMVKTLEGPRRIERIFPKQIKDAVKVTAIDADGNVIASQVQGSSHRLLTTAGWVCHGKFCVSSPSLTSVPKGFCSVLPFLTGCALQYGTALRYLGWSAYHSVHKALSSSMPLHHLVALAMTSVLGRPRWESVCVAYSDCTQEAWLPVLRSDHRGPFGLGPQMDGGRRSTHGTAFLYDMSDDQRRSLSEGSMDHCSRGLRQYGGRTPGALGSSPCEDGGQLYLHQSGDAVPPIPTCSHPDVQGRTHGYTCLEPLYDHPYRTGKRQATESVRVSSFDVQSVGVQELYDIEVEEVNHYITGGGFINKNCFDEAVQFLEMQVRYLCGWNRSTVPEQRCRIVMATNPPITADGYWIIPMFAPWLDITFPNPAKEGDLRWVVTDPDGRDMWVDGEHDVKTWNGKDYHPISRTFIHGELSDNPYLINTDYSKRLDQLPEPMRSAYRDGNFMAAREDTVNQAIPTAWVLEAQNRWRPQVPEGIPMCSMGVDCSGGGKDPMIIARRFDGWFDEMHETAAKDIPKDRIGRYCTGIVVSVRRQEAKVIIDMGGGYGGSMYEILKENNIDPIPHKGAEKSTARTSDRNLGFYNKRSQVIWQFREALDPNQDGGSPIALPRDPELLADLTAPTFEIGTRGIQVETKEKVVDRLGRSTDKGDAVCMAWSGGDRRLYQGRLQGRSGGGRKPEVMTKKTQRGQKRRKR